LRASSPSHKWLGYFQGQRRDGGNGHRDGRAPRQSPNWWQCASTGQWQFGVDERGEVALNLCNMKTAWLILGVFVGLSFAGCKPKEQVIANKVVESEQALITGQIFIVTKGRANVVLGDEKIALLDAHETRTYFNSKAVEWSNALAVAQVKVDQTATIYDALYKEDLAKLEASKKWIFRVFRG
jgi:hypothetical protein